MQGCLTKLRILFHCLLDGGQFTVSRRYTKTPLRFGGSGVLRKVDSPLNCCLFVCSC